MNNRVITISRQYGSGGRQIGAELARRLDIPFYDRKIIDLAAEQSGVSSEFIEELQQKGNYLTRDFSFGIHWEPTMGDKVYLAQYSIIRELAEKGPCVIVGRGAGGALKDTVPLLNVFIFADLESRKQRAIGEYGDSPHKIEERLAAIDKKRTAYFRFYSDVDSRRMENYHLCIDSGFMGIDGAVTLIETAYLLEIKKNDTTHNM